jgi:hypothetical protein
MKTLPEWAFKLILASGCISAWKLQDLPMVRRLPMVTVR